MNRRKISAMLAVALITSQVQGITFAETKASSQEIDKVVLENLDDNNSDSIVDEKTDTQEGISEENSESITDDFSNEENGEISQGDVINEEEKAIENESNKNVETTETEKENIDESQQGSEQYKVTGKLELDINFDSPIKVANSEKTDISVKIIKDGKSNTVKLGSNVTSGKLDNSNITYNLEALDYSRNKLAEGETELDFYHLTFENLELGTYSVEISGKGYQTATMNNIEIQNSSKRILLGTDEKRIELEDGSVEHYPTEKENIDESQQGSEQYKVTGKLELDINFDSPIKVANSEKTDISVKIIKDGKSNTVKLGSNVTSGKLDNSNITYNLEALDYSRNKLAEGETELDFYHLTFENLELGTYSVEISGKGYQTATMNNIEIQNSSKRILLGTDEKRIELEDGSVEHYPGVLISGDFDSDGSVTKDDYEILKNAIKSKSSDDKFDLNRDGKVDITDLIYVHQNINKTKNTPIIVDTDPIINPDNISIKEYPNYS